MPEVEPSGTCPGTSEPCYTDANINTYASLITAKEAEITVAQAQVTVAEAVVEIKNCELAELESEKAAALEGHCDNCEEE